MQKKLFYAMCAVAICTACHEAAIEPLTEASKTVRLEVSLPEVDTKISGSSSESTVNDLQVFVFDDGGMLEAYGNTQSSSLSLDCIPGTKQVVALVNAPDLSGISSYAGLTGQISSLSDNEVGTLVMEGEKSVNLATSTTVTVPVSRLVAKISLVGITNELALDYHRNQSFTVVSAYLINVAGTKTYLSDSQPDVWYNKMKYSSELETMLWETLGNTLIKPSASYSKTHYFYCYPNDTENDYNDGTWQARHTRLVVEAKIGTDTYYYPVTLPQIEQNTAYEVSLTVTRPGSDSPDRPVDTETASFTVKVLDWVDGGDINEVI